MGTQRLSKARLAFAFAFASAFATLGCGGGAKNALVTTSQPSVRHFQVVPAMSTEERRALIARLRERNPAPPGAEWTVNDEALLMSLTVVDPFSRFIRRARRAQSSSLATAAPIDSGEAVQHARAFVKKNHDLLGIPHALLPTLDEHVRPVAPNDHAGPRARWVVHFDTSFPTKGFEAFSELGNTIDLDVLVDHDGEPSSFVNLSHVHPRPLIDTRPGLREDDPRVVAHLLGRTLFALLDDRSDGGMDWPMPKLLPPRHEPQPPKPPQDVRALRRVPLGEVRAEDVHRVRLVMHVANGPQLAWLAYHLAYAVDIAKPASLDLHPDVAIVPGFYFFRYVVDADTGEVLEDARPPISPWGVPPP